ncbi:uncharacterized protein LOC127787343 [Diospyros lotus]|uniref:uncharacterized protein LOC127787343 n=1 Tax=Diospyros lotus TaxID=55363 RepID=UPI00224C8C89|nr:uncharacterized protein LOC127787343 [Diospyros lotus]
MDLQTLKMDHHHRRSNSKSKSKSISNYIPKKPHKFTKKRLESAHQSVAGDDSLHLPIDLEEFSLLPDIPEAHPFRGSAESFVTSLSPELLPSSETISPAYLSPLHSAITASKDEADDVSLGLCASAESKNSNDIIALEAEIVVNHLRQALSQVAKATDVDLPSKMLLNALIEMVVEQFDALPEERDRFAEVTTKKIRVVFLTLLAWLLAMFAVFLFGSRGRSSVTGPPPT